MPVCIGILTGRNIRISSLWNYFRHSDFLHSLWVRSEDLVIFSKHSILRDVRLQPGETPHSLEGRYIQNIISYYNIAQFLTPWRIFEYFLYHRQTGFGHAGFRFVDQVKLYDYAKAYEITEKSWVSDRCLRKQLSGKYYILPETKGVSLFDIRTSFYLSGPTVLFNISQTNDPLAFRKLLDHHPRSPICGKYHRHTFQTALCEASVKKGFQSEYWLTEKEIPELQHLGVKLQENAEGTKVIINNGAREVFYHAEQTNNPLRLQKASCEVNYIFQSCVDFVTGRRFSPQDTHQLIHFRFRGNFRSEKWIRSTDLEIFGAIIRPDQKNQFVECSSGVWYNFDQFINKANMIRARIAIRTSIQTACQSDHSSLKLLSDVLDGESPTL